MSGGEFAAIEARAEAATGGPWKWTEHRVPDLVGVVLSEFYSYDTEVIEAEHSGECGCRSACELNLNINSADAEFIAHAREDIPRPLAAVRERDDTIARAEAAVASAALKVLADFDTVMNVKGEVAYIVAEYNRALRAALDPQETE